MTPSRLHVLIFHQFQPSRLCSLPGLVIFNISDIRSDAFLITTDNIRSIHLRSLTLSKINDFVKRFYAAIDVQDLTQYRHAIHQMNGILEELWDFAVSRILNELGFTQMSAPDEAWPRV